MGTLYVTFYLSQIIYHSSKICLFQIICYFRTNWAFYLCLFFCRLFHLNLICAAKKNRVEASTLLYRRANEQDFAIKPEKQPPNKIVKRKLKEILCGNVNQESH